MIFHPGKKALARKQRDEALQIGRESLEIGLRHASLFHLMGLAHWEKGDTGEAVTYFRKALEYDPGLTSSAMALGKVMVRICP